MNSIQCKMFTLIRNCRIQKLPFRACISTLQFSSQDERYSPLAIQQGCRPRLIRHSPLIYQQCRLVKQNAAPKIDTRVTPLEVPGKGKLVYLGAITPRIKLLKMFSVATSITACILMPGLVGDLSEMHIIGKIIFGTGLGIFIFLSPVLVHLLTKRYVIWMYYDQDTNKFTATTYNFLAREVDHVFTPEDVEHYNHGLLSSIKVHNVPLSIDASMFFDRSLYSKLMRFDTEEWALPDEYYADKQRKEKDKT